MEQTKTKTTYEVAGEILRGLSYLRAEMDAGDIARTVEAATRLLGAMDNYDGEMREATGGDKPNRLAARWIVAVQEARTAVGVVRYAAETQIDTRIKIARAELNRAESILSQLSANSPSVFEWEYVTCDDSPLLAGPSKESKRGK